jgi:hypothetical protein
VSLISYLIPNLIQGVSQQPDAQRQPTQADEQINGVSSLSEGLRKREGSQALAKISDNSLGNVMLHHIQRDQVEQYMVVISRTRVQVFEQLTGAERTVVAPEGYGYLASGANARTDLRAATIADFTFISNTKVKPAMASPLAPAAPRPFPHECLVWVKAANYGQTYEVNLNGTLVSVQTAVQAVVVDGNGKVTENRISAAEIARQLRQGLLGVNNVEIARRSSVLWIRSDRPITIEAADARSNSDITAITNTVQAFTDLPTIAPGGYQVEVVGDPSNKFDGYHVAFAPRSGAFGEGQWEETVAPGVPYQIDPSTMPHVLVRRPNGTFLFGPADGTVTQEAEIPSWGQRTAGNLDSSPDPGFIGHPIQDVFVFKNRLGFLADENIILSRSRDFFEFFPETATAVLDTDPIDITATNPRVALLRHAIPYQDELIIFADQIQFRFNASAAALTPSTAQITVLTQYEIDPDVRPIPVAGAIVFCQANGEWSQFREFSIRGAGTALVADAADLTSYVSSYVPNEVLRLAANDTGYSWFTISEKPGFRNHIYVFKYFSRNVGEGMQREQSSWSYWRFSSAQRILQIVCVQETLYVVIQYPDGEVWLEKLSARDSATEVDGRSPMLLDRMVSTTAATPGPIRVSNGEYDADAKTTTWVLPYRAESLTQAWSGYAPGQTGGVLLGETLGGRRITARGDWRNKEVWFGAAYEFLYRFTRFRLYRDAGGGRVPGNVERLQVRHAKIRYHGSEFFEAWVLAERREPAVYTFTHSALAVRNSLVGIEEEGPYADSLQEGVFTVPIQSNGEKCVVELRNSTARPCRFASCEWVGMVHTKARAMR